MRTTAALLVPGLAAPFWSTASLGQGDGLGSFYQGKTIELLVGHSAGGGYDT